MQTTTKRKTVIENNGRYWGVLYEDGRFTAYGWGPIEKAKFVDPRYCRKPEDATWKGSHHIKELRKGRLLNVLITTIVEIIK